METLRGFKQMVITINGNPIGLRLLGYLMLLVGFALLVSSVIVVAFMAWGILESLLAGNFPPSINENSDWDIR